MKHMVALKDEGLLLSDSAESVVQDPLELDFHLLKSPASIHCAPEPVALNKMYEFVMNSKSPSPPCGAFKNVASESVRQRLVLQKPKLGILHESKGIVQLKNVRGTVAGRWDNIEYSLSHSANPSRAS